MITYICTLFAQFLSLKCDATMMGWGGEFTKSDLINSLYMPAVTEKWAEVGHFLYFFYPRNRCYEGSGKSKLVQSWTEFPPYMPAVREIRSFSASFSVPMSGMLCHEGEIETCAKFLPISPIYANLIRKVARKWPFLSLYMQIVSKKWTEMDHYFSYICLQWGKSGRKVTLFLSYNCISCPNIDPFLPYNCIFYLGMGSKVAKKFLPYMAFGVRKVTHKCISIPESGWFSSLFLSVMWCTMRERVSCIDGLRINLASIIPGDVWCVDKIKWYCICRW